MKHVLTLSKTTENACRKEGCPCASDRLFLFAFLFCVRFLSPNLSPELNEGAKISCFQCFLKIWTDSNPSFSAQKTRGIVHGFFVIYGFLSGESGFEAALRAAARTRAVHIRSPAGCSTGRPPYRVTSYGKSVRKRPVAVFVTLHGSSLRSIPPSPRKRRAREGGASQGSASFGLEHEVIDHASQKWYNDSYKSQLCEEKRYDTSGNNRFN